MPCPFLPLPGLLLHCHTVLIPSASWSATALLVVHRSHLGDLRFCSNVPMALRSEAAAAAAAAEFCCAYAPVGVKGAARTISCKPLAIGCSMSWTRGVDEEGTSLVSYGSLGRESQWLSGNFLDLRLRSATLFSTEASGALKRHFESREPVQEEVRNEELPAITSSPHQMLHSAFEDAAIFDIEMLLRNHLTRVSGPRCSILDESWC